MKHICKKGLFWGVVAVAVLLLASLALAQDGTPPPTMDGLQVHDLTGVGQMGVSVYFVIQIAQAFGKLTETLGRFTDHFGRFVETTNRLLDSGLKLEDVRAHAGAVTELSAAIRDRAST